MELDKKVRWRNLRNEVYYKILGYFDYDNGLYESPFPDDMIERVKAYKNGLYESPKEYVDGYAVNDGSWVKYCYNGRRRCKNKEEIGRYFFISLNTVKYHLKKIYAKLEASSSTQAVWNAKWLGVI